MSKSKQLLVFMMILVMSVSLFAGCGGNSGTATAPAADTPEAEQPAENSTVTTQLTDKVEGANDFEMWAFVELHGQFYADMLKRWNDENPDEQMNIEFVVMPYDDMHNKMTLAVQSGEGAPDFCDIEIGKFPAFLQGQVPFADLTSYVDTYRGEIVESRVDIYSKDGKNYGIPTHVGAVVAFYNTEILDAAGVDYNTIKTWDDYKEAGLKVKDAGHIMGVAETNNAMIFDAMLNAQGADKTDVEGKPTLDTPEAIRAMTTMQEFANLGIDQTIDGGHPDTEQAWGVLNGGEYATVIRPLWMMSRYLNYMEDLKGKVAIAPAPIFADSKFVSFGGGGTGTVIYKDCENIDLAARWLTYAKLSKVANEQIWNVLGFDPVNTDLWNDEALTHNADNKFIAYFQNNPFDVLNAIKDNMGIIKATSGVPTVNNIICNITLNDVLLNGVDPATALKDAQEQAMNELGL